MSIDNNLVTDTIVISSNKADFDVTSSDIISKLQQWLGTTILLSHEVVAANPIQLIILRNFKRILVISPDIQLSKDIMVLFQMKEEAIEKGLKDLQFSFTLANTNAMQKNGKGPSEDQKEYLKLPPADKLFLISPPSSPPPEFDYTKCEDIPQINKKVHSPNHLGAHHKDKSPKKCIPKMGSFTILTSNVANIVIDQCPDLRDDKEMYITADSIRTAAPPRSIFDTDEEIENENEKETDG